MTIGSPIPVINASQLDRPTTQPGRRPAKARAMVVAASAIGFGLVLHAGPVLAQAGDQDAKPDVDGSQDMGITPADVEDMEKGKVGTAPRARPAPAVEPAPPTREARPSEPEPAPGPRDRFAGNPYVWGSLGWVDGEDADLSGAQTGEADIGHTIHYAGALGWHFDNGLRAEIEANHFDVDVNGFNGVPVSGDVEVTAGLFNLVYELPMTRYLHPYAGAGVGIASVDTQITLPGNSSGDDTVMAWQFIGGTAVDVTQNLALTFDYRYFETDDPDFIGIESEMSAHKALAGIRYTFGGR